MKQFRFRLTVWLMVFAFVIISCSDDNDEPKEVVLIDATPILTRTANELRTYLGASGIDIDVNTLKYDVELYRVRYRTTYKDTDINASGIVVLPQTTDAVGMVSFQHGTIVSKADAPTELPLSDTELILYAALSSAGFVGVMPDYIGFGESDNLFHPYYVEEATAQAVIDNIRAAKALAQKEKINFNKKLFLAGYSQGGYATMAAHKAIEEHSLNGINLIASFPAAGGYDVKGVQEYFFDQTTYDQPHYIAYVAMSYKSYYDWTGTLDDFFQEPYASDIPSLFDGTKGASQINAELTESIVDLIHPDLLANIDTNPDYAYLVNAFNENSLLDWTPTIPMHMYHGDADTTVPYQNSVDTYSYLIAHGASEQVVTFTTLPGADHGSGVIPYIEDFTEKLLDLQ